MSRRSSRNEYRTTQLLITSIYLLLIGLLAMATASADEGERSSMTRQYAEGGRDSSTITAETLDSFAPLTSVGERSRRGREQANAKAGSESPAVARASSDDFWIFDADVILFGDDDVDGYFFGIDLLFDADTIFSSADVYAVLYLSLDGGPWNEYAATEDFRINGATSDDEFVVVTELQSGYPSGDYDLLIELFDADTGEFLTDFGPESSSALSLLPLEDFNRDDPVFDTPVTISRGSGGGGAASGFVLMLLTGFCFRRLLSRKSLSAAPYA